MRVIVDTNVLISAFAFGGNAEKVLDEVLAQGELIISPFILEELDRVLSLKFEVPKSQTRKIKSLLEHVGVLIHPHTTLPSICRDPDDNHILQLAESTDAEFVITGDKDLLVLAHFGQTQIVSPKAFLERLSPDKP